jgi:hypothetical protein
LVPGQPPCPPSNPPRANGPATELHAECERLRQVVKGLEEERRRDHEALAALRQECEAYRRAAHAWARKQFTPEELRDIPEAKDCAPLDQFLGELERSVRGS